MSSLPLPDRNIILLCTYMAFFEVSLLHGRESCCIALVSSTNNCSAVRPHNRSHAQMLLYAVTYSSLVATLVAPHYATVALTHPKHLVLVPTSSRKLLIYLGNQLLSFCRHC